MMRCPSVLGVGSYSDSTRMASKVINRLEFESAAVNIKILQFAANVLRVGPIALYSLIQGSLVNVMPEGHGKVPLHTVFRMKSSKYVEVGS